LPERDGSVEFVAMHDDRSDAYHASYCGHYVVGRTWLA